MDVFQIDSGDWIQQATSETPALGVSGYSCTAVGDSLYYFGGSCGHDGCYHNSMHKLSTSSLQWMMLSPSTSKSGAPMRKMDCGMVAFRDGEEDILCVVAGWGPTPSYRQPGAQYEADGTGYTSCNENHMFNLSTSAVFVVWTYGMCAHILHVLFRTSRNPPGELVHAPLRYLSPHDSAVLLYSRCALLNAECLYNSIMPLVSIARRISYEEEISTPKYVLAPSAITAIS